MDKEFYRLTVRWETTNKKATVQTKILILFLNRFHVLGQPSGKSLVHTLERCVSYLDLRRIRVPDTDPTRMELSLAGSDESLQFSCSLEDDCAKIVAHALACLRLHLPQVGQRLIDMSLPSRWQMGLLIAQQQGSVELVLSPAKSDKCGHFAPAYDLYSSYLDVAAKPEIKWDVNTIYFSQGTRTFCLRDFSHFRQEDCSAIIGALSFNDYFTGLDCSGVRLSDSSFFKSAEFLLSFNFTLSELLLSGCNLKNEFLRVFSDAAEKNSELRLTVLDLSDNKFDGDDKGVLEQLARILAHQSSSLEKLNLARCGLKRLNRSFELLSERLLGCQPLPLRHLCIDGCGVGGSNKNENVAGFENYLTKLHNLQHLSCSDCGLFLESLTPSLLKLTRCLVHLDLSRNLYNPLPQSGHATPAGFIKEFVRRPSVSSKTDDSSSVLSVAPSTDAWTKFFASCGELRHIRLNRCRLPAPVIHSLLVGLSQSCSASRGSSGSSGCSGTLSGLSLELAGNEFGSAGAQILCNSFINYRIEHLESLDLSDNDFGAEMNKLIEAICKTEVAHLAIGGSNFRCFLRRDQTQMQEFSDLVTDDRCRLTSLSIRGARLERGLAILLNCLGQCKNLSRLDISDNHACDFGARTLAKALFINTSLVELRLDGNKIGASGLRDLAESLRFNQTLLRLPLPLADIASAGSAQQQLLHEAAELLQEGLVRNNQRVSRQVTAKDYRLRAELSNYPFTADSCTAQAELAISTINAVAAPSDVGVDEIFERVRRCRSAASDADSAKRLLISLQDVVDVADSATNRCLTVELPAPAHAALSADLSAAQSEMLRRAAAACPSAFATDAGLLGTLVARLASEDARCRARDSQVAATLSRSAGTALAADLSVLKLNSALTITAYMQDVVIHNLQQSLDSLNSLVREKVFVPTLRRNLEAAAKKVAQTLPTSSHGGGSHSRPMSVYPDAVKPTSHHHDDDAPAAIIDDDDDVKENNESDDTREQSERTPMSLTCRPPGLKDRRLPTRGKQRGDEANSNRDGSVFKEPLSTLQRPLPPTPVPPEPLPPTPSLTKPLPPTPSLTKPLPSTPSITKPLPPTPSLTKPLPSTPSITKPLPSTPAPLTTNSSTPTTSVTPTMNQNPTGPRLPPGAVAIPGMAIQAPRPQPQQQQPSRAAPPTPAPKTSAKPPQAILRKINTIDIPASAPIEEPPMPVPQPRKRGPKIDVSPDSDV